MKIRIAYHLVAQSGWEEITFNCINKLKTSGLWGAADEIHMLCHYTPALFDALRVQLNNDNRIFWHLFTDSIHTRGESFSNAKLKLILYCNNALTRRLIDVVSSALKRGVERAILAHERRQFRGGVGLAHHFQ